MRIWFSWAFSTGKSTLWANAFKEWHIKNKEVARTILEEKQIRPDDFTVEQLDHFQSEVLETQLAIEKESSSFLQDTTLLDFLAYAKDAPSYDLFLKKVMKHFNKRAYDIIFYTPIEFDIEDDWVRHLDVNFQKTIADRIEYLLHMTACKNSTVIYNIKWTLEERIEKVNNILKEIK